MNIDDYLALIPPPNNIQPNFMAWVRANLQPLIDIQTVLNSINAAFTVDNAIGVQLDIIGQTIGQSRTVDFTPEGGVSPVLDDTNYRLILLAKILKNQWKGTKREIYDFWRKWFPNYALLIQDNQDMTMNVIVFGIPVNVGGEVIFGYGPEGSGIGGYGSGYWSGFRRGLLSELVRAGYFVPKPAGVSVNYSFVDSPVFGYGPESDFVKGYGTGAWIGVM